MVDAPGGDVWIPVAVGAALFLWWVWIGRDPSPGSIVPRWDPPAIPPGTAGALIDQRADTADVLATILDLARRGYFTIRESHPSGVPAEGGEGVALLRDILSRVGLWQTEWEFTRTGKPIDDLIPTEGAVVAALFADGPRVGASALSGRLRERLPAIYASLHDDLVRRGWFLSRPDRVRRDWWMLAGAFGLAAVASWSWAEDPGRAVALAASGALVALAAPAMPASTAAGARARAEALGVAEYLRRAEKDEIEARHGGKRTPEELDALLPWAIALGVTDLWVQRFEDLLPDARPWYMTEGATAGSLAVQIGGFVAVAGLLLASGEG
ncbi:MAG TPA: hypothetical protein VM778_13860 [Gemmatimonadota bacterium]|nr:hypothetical protein [Gemmatimonadota bacterium]